MIRVRLLTGFARHPAVAHGLERTTQRRQPIHLNLFRRIIFPGESKVLFTQEGICDHYYPPFPAEICIVNSSHGRFSPLEGCFFGTTGNKQITFVMRGKIRSGLVIRTTVGNRRNFKVDNLWDRFFLVANGKRRDWFRALSGVKGSSLFFRPLWEDSPFMVR